MGSYSLSQQTTNTADKRQVVDNGIGVSADNGASVVVNSLDEGVVKMALDAVTVADASNNDGFKSLLGLADKLIVSAGNTIEKGQAATLAQIAQVGTAQNDARGAIDQKTITMAILAAGAVAVVYFWRRG